MGDFSNFSPALMRAQRNANSSNYDIFLENLYDELMYAERKIQKSAKYYEGTKFLEDRLNHDICDHLHSHGFSAAHDTDNKGHVDIYVKSCDEKYIWFGEGKVHSGSSYAIQGFEQIAHYTNCGKNCNHDGVIIYINSTTKSCSQILVDVITSLSQHSSFTKDFLSSKCKQDDRFYIVSYTHPTLGKHTIRLSFIDIRY